MLAYKPEDRITAADALNDPWIVKLTTAPKSSILSKQSALALRSLKNFNVKILETATKSAGEFKNVSENISRAIVLFRNLAEEKRLLKELSEVQRVRIDEYERKVVKDSEKYLQLHKKLEAAHKKYPNNIEEKAMEFEESLSIIAEQRTKCVEAAKKLTELVVKIKEKGADSNEEWQDLGKILDELVKI